MGYLPYEAGSKCEWGACKNAVTNHVTTSDGADSAFLCGYHKKVALINIEKYDRVHSPGNDRGAAHGKRPNSRVDPPMPKRIAKYRPENFSEEKWEQDAAKSADKNAKELKQEEPNTKLGQEASNKIAKLFPKISDIPKPRSEN